MTSHERRNAPAAPTGPRIIVQYRQKSSKVYELESNGEALAVRICHVDETASSMGWRVDVQTGAEHAAPVEGWGTTAADALRELARAWNSHYPALRAFDWEAIARVLHVVQAI